MVFEKIFELGASSPTPAKDQWSPGELMPADH
jgi:hypothetical protein